MVDVTGNSKFPQRPLIAAAGAYHIEPLTLREALNLPTAGMRIMMNGAAEGCAAPAATLPLNQPLKILKLH